MSEFDERGQWTGTCPKCDTNHRGWPPGTLGADVACIRSQITAVATPAADALLARLDAKLVRAVTGCCVSTGTDVDDHVGRALPARGSLRL